MLSGQPFGGPDQVGEATEALRSLHGLLADQQRALGLDAPELFGLRQQAALLAAGVGDVVDARRQLEDLLADVRRLHGPDSPDAADIQAMLAHLARLEVGAREDGQKETRSNS